MHGGHHRLVLRGTGDGQNIGMRLLDALGIRAVAHTASDNHAPVGGHGFADGIQRLLLGAVDKATGVYHHHIGSLVGGHYVVAFEF